MVLEHLRVLEHLLSQQAVTNEGTSQQDLMEDLKGPPPLLLSMPYFKSSTLIISSNDGAEEGITSGPQSLSK